MASVMISAKLIFLKRCELSRKTLRRWLLTRMRNMLWRADEWIQKQEVCLRDEAMKPAYVAEVDPIQSRKRERTARAARPRMTRLKYQHGEFVKQ